MIKECSPADVILKTIDEKGVDQVIIGKSGKSGRRKISDFSGCSQSQIVTHTKLSKIQRIFDAANRRF